MCGIAGFVSTVRNRAPDELRRIVVEMTRTLTHRGPDDEGLWVNAEHGVALGHRRLSILDLSPSGRQPMHSADGRFTVVFNGEIYNFREMRAVLERAGHAFRGHSDTEILLAAVLQWGVVEALKKFVGMFAFGLWDAKERVLTLARDRAGEKPLYYGWVEDRLAFGSELKALRACAGASLPVDRDALALYLVNGYIPGAHSIHRGIQKLLPGCCVQFTEQRLFSRAMPEPAAYWSMRLAASAGLATPFKGNDQAAVDELDRLLRRSVAGQMVADVPVGAFLSGGIDSSAVVAAMQAQSSRPVRTFTIGFHEQEYNEAKYASAVAAHLQTDHTELCVTPAEAMSIIPRLPEIYDEPFSDPSQIPTCFVSLLARRHVTVSLSGDGGDELFAGYSRYMIAQKLWSRIGKVPSGWRRAAARFLKSVPPRTWNRCFDWAFDLAGKPGAKGLLGDRIPKAAEYLDFETEDAIYARATALWKNAEQMVIGATPGIVASTALYRQLSGASFLDKMCFADSVAYLPDDILVKVDRASMAVSLESRVPMLDHRLIEFAWSLPAHFKVRAGKSKWLLRQVLYRYVPPKLVERPKMGFGVPMDHWLRGPLREWGEEQLSERRLKADGFFDPKPIRQKWEEHVSGRRRWHFYLWTVLMFQAWLESQSKPAAVQA